MERLFITGGSGLLGSKFTRIDEDDYALLRLIIEFLKNAIKL